MKIRILELVGHEYVCGQDYNYGETIYMPSKATEWEEVTEQEYTALCSWATVKNRNSHTKIVIITEVKEDIPKIVADYLAIAKKEAEKKQEAAEKRKKKEEKKQQTIAAKKEAREKELFKKLKEKFDN